MNKRINIRHCEEHSDEAIQDISHISHVFAFRADMESAPTMDCLALLAMMGVMVRLFTNYSFMRLEWHLNPQKGHSYPDTP